MQRPPTKSLKNHQNQNQNFGQKNQISSTLETGNEHLPIEKGHLSHVQPPGAVKLSIGNIESKPPPKLESKKQNQNQNFSQKNQISSTFGTGNEHLPIEKGHLSHSDVVNSSKMGNQGSKPPEKGKKSKSNNRDLQGKNKNDCKKIDLSSEFRQLSIKPSSSKKATKNDVIKIDFNPQDVLYYGWFFDEIVSGSINLVAFRYYRECLENVVNFKRFIQRLCDKNNIKDPMDYYVHPRKKPGKPHLYHITSKFIGREDDPTYTKKIMKYLEKSCDIQMVGLFFTEKCFGIRVKLNDEQIEIFHERKSDRFGQLSISTPPSNSKPKQSQSTSRKDSSNDLLENEIPTGDGDNVSKPTSTEKQSKSKKKQQQVFYEGLKMIPQELKKSSESSLEFHFQPTQSRAHITIGVSKGVKPVETGNDLIDIIDLETRRSVFRQDFQLPDNNGILRQFYKDAEAFVLYPSHSLCGAATFNAFI